MEPSGDSATRFIVRGRSAAQLDTLRRAFDAVVFEPVHFVMERKMMTTIKARAEGKPGTPVADGLEILAWVGVFVAFVASAVALLAGPRLRRMSCALVVSAAAFQGLTLLQPGPAIAWLSLVMVAILFWPAHGVTRAGTDTLLHQVLPHHEFAGVIAVPVHASGRELFRALRQVTLADMPIAALLGELRYLPGRLLGRGGPRRGSSPFLEQLLSSGNIVLAWEPGRELVVGAIGKFHQVLDQQLFPLLDSAQFRLFRHPEYQKLAMSFRVEETENGRYLVLEHRTHALSRSARRAFARYWLFIQPTGHFVSWLLLRAVRRLAERRDGATASVSSPQVPAAKG
jgi:hypothetical protein